MNIRPEERLQLWNLFQACDLDRDGLIDVNDIRALCKKTEFSDEYTPEAIMDLFDMTDDTKIGFEDFVAKKKAHDQLAFSESTSISSDLTNQTADESLLSDPFGKDIFNNSNIDIDVSDQDYDPDLSDYSAKLDNYSELLPKKLSSLNLDANQIRTNLCDTSSGYTTTSSLRSGAQYQSRDRNNLNKYLSGSFADLIDSVDLSSNAKRKLEQIHQVSKGLPLYYFDSNI